MLPVLSLELSAVTAGERGEGCCGVEGEDIARDIKRTLWSCFGLCDRLTGYVMGGTCHFAMGLIYDRGSCYCSRVNRSFVASSLTDKECKDGLDALTRS